MHENHGRRSSVQHLLLIFCFPLTKLTFELVNVSNDCIEETKMEETTTATATTAALSGPSTATPIAKTQMIVLHVT